MQILQENLLNVDHGEKCVGSFVGNGGKGEKVVIGGQLCAFVEFELSQVAGQPVGEDTEDELKDGYECNCW